jgi:hypothetical protein
MRNIWRKGNHLILLPEGKRYTPEILATIDDANGSVLIRAVPDGIRTSC